MSNIFNTRFTPIAMKRFLYIFLFSISHHLLAQITVSEIGNIPKKTSNNVVCEGFINGDPYIYSFGGIDSTKHYSGIHQESFRYNINTNQTITLPNLPDTLGKIAMGISRIDDIIYLTGGYHVYANGNERSSDRIHRFDITNNLFLPDGTNIPVATDDHVQGVWRDSLIYLITGWSDVGNIADVQIYNPTTDHWLTGTSVPNSAYKSFGSSGTIIGDTIYYFGGAYSSAGFNIQNRLRKGVINPNDPTDITWSISTPNSSIKGYRMASTTVGNEIHWIGGSNTTYNYNGIAYNGSGGVEPNNRDLFITTTADGVFNEYMNSDPIPMDLRSIAKVNDTTQYIIGGMLSGQEVTNKIFKLEWTNPNLSITHSNVKPTFTIEKNPVHSKLHLYTEQALNLFIYNISGQRIQTLNTQQGYQHIDISHIPNGIYFIRSGDLKQSVKKIIIQH